MGFLYVLQIVHQTASDGPGLRNSLYLSGCSHHCPDCHNPQSWDILNGQKWNIQDILKELIDPYSDITITGGDPFFQVEGLYELLQQIHQYYPQKNVWVYTGYQIEELTETQRKCLPYINVLVDGKYIKEQRDLSRFCGSRNQRIIHLQNGKIFKIE